MTLGYIQGRIYSNNRGFRTFITLLVSLNINQRSDTRDWYSGIMTAFQADETGSIPVFRSRDNHRVSKLCDKLSPPIGQGS